MAVATGTALAIAAGAQAAGAGVAAKMRSSASKKAAAAQEAATRQSSQYIQQGINQLGPMYAPYINAGAGAMGTLGRLTSPGPGARFASPGPPNVMPPMGGGGMPPMGGGGMAYPQQRMPPGGGRMQMPDGRPVAGPYPMAEGGDFNVAGPTMFLAGEAGPERATFQPQGGGNAQWGGMISGPPPGASSVMPGRIGGGGNPAAPGGMGAMGVRGMWGGGGGPTGPGAAQMFAGRMNAQRRPPPMMGAGMAMGAPGGTFAKMMPAMGQVRMPPGPSGPEWDNAMRGVGMVSNDMLQQLRPQYSPQMSPEMNAQEQQNYDQSVQLLRAQGRLGGGGGSDLAPMVMSNPSPYFY